MFAAKLLSGPPYYPIGSLDELLVHCPIRRLQRSVQYFVRASDIFLPVHRNLLESGQGNSGTILKVSNSGFKVISYTDKKENQIFLIYKEVQGGAVAKSYKTNGLLIYGEIFAHFLIC
jgi:hypothetical protein